MRIIDADDIVYESIDSTVTRREESYYGTGILAVRKEDIDAMPTIELPERKTGKWEIYIISMLDGEGCKCSECGFEGAPYWDYCPNCGADMRTEGNDDN